MDLGKYLDFFMGGLIKGPKNFEVLSSGTYLFGAILSILMVLIAAIIAKNIYSVPDRSDIPKRKRWFWFLSGVAPILFALYNYFLVLNNIKSVSYQSDFQTQVTINFFVMFVTYVAFGFLLSFIFRKGVIGDWFFSSKKYK